MSNSAFIRQPSTTSDQPHVLMPGQSLEVQVVIENHSKVVDHFSLVCTDLPRSYFSVQYPDAQDPAGQTIKMDSLALQPGEHGRIQLCIHPPTNAPEGNYGVILHVKSTQNAELRVPKVVYFHIPPVYDLDVTLTPSVANVTQPLGLFEISLTNYGNVERSIILKAKSLESENLCAFTLASPFVQLAPGDQAHLDLTVRLKGWWHRLFGNINRELTFTLDLQDPEGFPLPQDSPQGRLVWSPFAKLQRSRWLIPLILLFGGGIAAIAALGWHFLLKPALLPRIVELKFTPDSDLATSSQAIRLSWKITRPQQIEKLVLVQHQPNGTEQNTTYPFKTGIPSELQLSSAKPTNQFCQYQTAKAPEMLVCQGILTQTDKPGSHFFSLQVFERNHPNRPVHTRTTELITIKPDPPPQIVKFYSPKSIYKHRTHKTPQSSAIPSTAGSPLAPTALGTPPGSGAILLNWEISSPTQLKELQVLGLATAGKNNSPLQRYSFEGGNLPQSLNPFCTLKEQLVCRNVPTQATKPGKYSFKLTVVPQQKQSGPNLTKIIGPIQIEAQPLRIASFQINAQDAPPNYIYDISKSDHGLNLNLSWQVEGGDNVKVSLLPVPGVVPRQGSATYQINPQRKRSRITLKATDANGAQISRSVDIEIKDSTLTAQTQPEPSPKAQSKPLLQSAPPTPSPQQTPIATRPLPTPTKSPPPSAQTTRATPAQTSQPSTRPTISKVRPSAPISRSPSQSTPTSAPSAVSKPLHPALKQGIEEANAIMRGLVVARQNGWIKPYSTPWKRTQDAVYHLRRGKSRAEAAQRARIPLYVLTQLLEWGQRRSPAAVTSSPTPNRARQ